MVIYFTGTGNSRYIAELIAVNLGDTITGANGYIKAGGSGEFFSEKPYVFVCPAYAWRIPHVFESFIRSSAFGGNNMAYFVMSYACTGIGNAGSYIEKICTGRDLKYMGVFRVKMPQNYILMLKAQEKEKAEEIIATAEKTIPLISGIIKAGSEFPRRGRWIIPLSKIGNLLYYSLIITDKGFRATEKCTGCGECARLCPMNNIRIENRRPVFGGRCTQCLACICGCRMEAIEYKNRTVGKKRYYLRKSAL